MNRFSFTPKSKEKEENSQSISEKKNLDINISINNSTIQEIINRTNKLQGEKTKKLIKDILLKLINNQKEELKKVCFDGLPDDLPILRSLIWKINLKYLNFDIDKWEEYTEKKRKEYEDIKAAFLLKMEIEKKLHEELEQATISSEQKPDLLDTARENKINELKKFTRNTDKELLELIDNDVRRTHTDLNFFFMPCKKEKLAEGEVIEIVERRRSIVSGQETKTLDDIYNTQDIIKYETHANVLSRILYIYAKLNPEIIYVQGMNEILAPIYYCFSFDSDIKKPEDSELKINEEENNVNSLEADTFWAFSMLMEDLKGIFMRKKDESNEGIFIKIQSLWEMLRIVDKELFDYLNKHNVEISHFAFRWFILLFTQDFVLPDVLRLWDAIISERDRFYSIYYISLGILKIKKSEIMGLDFAEIIMSLQNVSQIDVDKIFEVIRKIKKDYDKKIRWIMNSQTVDKKK